MYSIVLSIMRILLALLLVPAGAAPVFADCAFGDNSLPGSIGPGQRDRSRSYTIEGRAVLTVAGAVDAAGEPVDLVVGFPDHCRPREGPTVSCTVEDYGVVNVVIINRGWRQATYKWVCTSLY